MFYLGSVGFGFTLPKYALDEIWKNKELAGIPDDEMKSKKIKY